MFYRRKVILALLQLFDGQLDKIRLQKLLFLFTLRQTKTEYDFIPYKYGCYSYSANADMTTMTLKDILGETKVSFSKLDKAEMALTKVLIAVKTYPTLSAKYDELVCTTLTY